jgi:hypothetical protein
MKTKNILTRIIGLFGVLILNTTQAMPPVANNIIVEKDLIVAFAPPEYQGHFRFQVLKTGAVQRIDNKGKVTRLAVLSPVIINEIQKMVKAIPDDLKVIPATGDKCMDVPSSYTYVYKSYDKQVIIRREEFCLTADTSNYIAVGVADWINRLEQSMSIGFHFNDGDNAPVRIGQEGYGAPALRNSIRILQCQEDVTVMDDGFSLFLEIIAERPNDFNLVIERSLLTGGETETFVVHKAEQGPIGSPMLYENKIVKLSVQGTATPRPDGKLPGTFIKKNLSTGKTEVRKLLCNYINE